MRVKRGVTKNRRHKAILKLAKGYRMSYSKTYRRAKEAVLHAGQYQYAHRRHRGAQMRVEWIKIISAGLSEFQLSYSKFVNLLAQKNIKIDRKNIAELATFRPESFKQLVEEVK